MIGSKFYKLSLVNSSLYRCYSFDYDKHIVLSLGGVKKNENMKIIESYYNEFHTRREKPNPFIKNEKKDNFDFRYIDHCAFGYALYEEEENELYSENIGFSKSPKLNKLEYYNRLSVYPDLFDYVNLNLTGKKYKFIHISLETEFYIKSEETEIEFEHNVLDFEYTTNHLNLTMNIIKLAFNYEIHFCFYNMTNHFNNNTDNNRCLSEWLVCVDENNLGGLMGEFEFFKFKNNLEISADVTDDSLNYFLKKSVDYLDWSVVNAVSVSSMFISFDYVEELNDFYWLGYFSNKCNFDYELFKYFNERTIEYGISQFNTDTQSYILKYNKKIRSYPLFVKENNLTILKERK